jgi:hypothetical protein
MTTLPNSLRDWNSARFTDTLKQEIENLPTGTLPLTQGLIQGGVPDDSNITVTVLSMQDNHESILSQVGIFFTEILAGCNCADDPMSMNGYCEIRVGIDKVTAEAEFKVISD